VEALEKKEPREEILIFVTPNIAGTNKCQTVKNNMLVLHVPRANERAGGVDCQEAKTNERAGEDK